MLSPDTQLDLQRGYRPEDDMEGKDWETGKVGEEKGRGMTHFTIYQCWQVCVCKEKTTRSTLCFKKKRANFGGL